MKRFIIFLCIFILSVFIGLKIAADPGYAYFSYQQWSVEMPLWFAVVAFIVLFVVGYMVLRLFDSIDFSMYRLKNWMRVRRKNKAYSKTNRGLIELIEGDWKNAERYLLEGISQSDAPLINYLGAAKAAHERGAYEQRDAYLRKAHAVAPQADMAIGLTQAELQLNQGQLEQALATLNHLRTVAPYHKVVLKLTERIYVQLGDWPALLKLLPHLRKAKLITDDQLRNVERKIFQELLTAPENKQAGVSGLRAVWEKVPKKMRQDPALIVCYVTQLLPYPEAASESEVLISKALVTAEANLKTQEADASLLFTIGKLCMRSQLWGKARHYFETSLRLEARPETYAEYAKLLDQLGEKPAAAEQYRKGLLLRAKPVL